MPIKIKTRRPDMDSKIPAEWRYGEVRCFKKRVKCSYLFEFFSGTRFDLPEFAEKYDGQQVKVLCRPYTKKVKDKEYNKLIVVSLTPLTAEELEWLSGQE